MDQKDLTLGTSAEEFYKQKEPAREAVIATGLRLAEMTIPSVFPPRDMTEGDSLPITNQSVNSSAVNTLASKLMLSAMPAGLPAIKYAPIEHALETDIEGDPDLWAKILGALNSRSEAHRIRMETTAARAAYVKAKKLEIVTGNTCISWIDINSPVVYNMNSYAVHRDALGNQLIVVVKLDMVLETLDDDIKQKVYDLQQDDSVEAPDDDKKNDWQETVPVYSVCKLIKKGNKKYWAFWQEVAGERVEGTEFKSPFDVPPLYAGWMVPNPGFDWGRAYSEDYEGDLKACETFAAALQDNAAAASRNITFVSPSGDTNRKAVAEAENLSTLSGDAKDVTQMQHNRSAEHQVTASEFQSAEKRIGRAYLQHSSIQRAGDRVTMAEWRILAEELDQAMGGLYSQIAASGQRWFMLRFAYLHEQEDKRLVPLPEGVVSVGVITGLDNLGQSQDYSKLVTLGDDASRILGPQVLASRTRVGSFLNQMTDAMSLKGKTLWKSDEEVAQESQQNQEQTMQMNMMDKAIGPLAKEGAGALAAMSQPQEEEQQGAP